MFSKPKLTHDERFCLAAFSHGLGVEATAGMMNCSSSKIKQLRLSIREKFSVGKLVEVLPLNELVTFINIMGPAYCPSVPEALFSGRRSAHKEVYPKGL